MLTPLGKFIANEEGAAFVEYALMVALIAIVGISAMQSFGHSVSQLFYAPNSAAAGMFHY